jgi:hypothetical protein
MEAWLGLIGAIAGGTVAWGLTQATQVITGRRKAAHDLNIAAFVCLDRLYKIQEANKHRNKKQRNYEIQLLGSDLDRYRDCIAARPKMWKRHWDFYCQMRPILLRRDLRKLGKIITELESFLKLG